MKVWAEGTQHVYLGLSKLKPEFWLTLFVLLNFFAVLGIPPLFTPDEGRYAEIAREMLASHDWIVPHLNGFIYFEKPPLTYWLTALSFKFFGLNEWAARLPSAGLSSLGVGFSYVMAKHLFSRRAGLLSAFILSTSLLYMLCAHLLITDTIFNVFLSLSLGCFLMGEKSAKKSLYLASYAFAALAILSKGLIGIVFPLLIIGLWTLLRRDFGVLKRMHLFWGALILLAIATPWHLLAQERVPTFLHEYFYVQHFLRYTTPIMGREMAWYWYLLIVLGACAPWILGLWPIVKITLKNSLHAQPISQFLLVWTGVIVGFFAFSHSILLPYLLPIVMPIALFLGRCLDLSWDHLKPKRQTLILLTGIGMAILTNILWCFQGEIVDRTVKPLALLARQYQEKYPELELASFNDYPQDYPFYARHTVVVVNWVNELAYGLSLSPGTTQWQTSGSYLETWNKPGLKISLIDRDHYPAAFSDKETHLLGESKNALLISNQMISL